MIADIIDYLHSIIKGVINLNKQQAQHLIKLARGGRRAEVTVNRYDDQAKLYKPLRTIDVDILELEGIWRVSQMSKQTEKFYRYDTPLGVIYSTKIQLFNPFLD